MLFLDIIIEDDKGEKENPEEDDDLPYKLSQEAVVLDMKVQDIKVYVTCHVSCDFHVTCHVSCLGDQF